jgi:N-acylneuraminate cytidylyltransferase
MIVALQTARAGSKSVVNKNIMKIGEKPLYMHPVDKSLESKLIDHVYISTDIKAILADKNSEYHAFERPKYLAKDNSSHHDVMIHGIQHIEKELNQRIEILVVLLGNTLGAEAKDLDNALRTLKENPEADSIVSLSEFNMFNPFRALKVSGGTVKTWVDQDKIREMKKSSNVNDKKSAGEIYFANGSFFICRRNVVMSKDGNLPFPWLGKNILPWIESASMEIDAPWQVDVLKSMLGRKID